jgi:LPXTG-motif cell wall-anchored protein
VEPSANIEGTSNLFNSADLSWRDKTIVTHPDTPTTDLTVHAIGVTKIDGDTDDLLAGAVFEIYADRDCTVPVYVIPTNVEGVYILDDLNTIVSGENRETSREKYKAYLDAYLNGAIQKNEVVTQLNGKLVVLGLEKGTYYLKETAAPSGYNKLATPVVIEIDGTTEAYTFATDDNGKVVEAAQATVTHTYNKVEGQPVENNKGVELPSTGGKGTMMLITIGTIVAMAFAVLLITHKKMSVYHD